LERLVEQLRADLAQKRIELADPSQLRRDARFLSA